MPNKVVKKMHNSLGYWAIFERKTNEMYLPWYDIKRRIPVKEDWAFWPHYKWTSVEQKATLADAIAYVESVGGPDEW